MRRPGDDRGSIPMALLVTIVGLSLSAAMSTLVLGQIKNSAWEARRMLALHAAQAGLDAGLGQVRLSAVDSNGLSHKENLPCATLTGPVGAGNAAGYSVTTAYYDSDPKGNLQDASWVSAHAIACVTGLGARTLPRYAVFTSTGTAAVQGGTSSRTLRGTYVVHTSNANISGGLIHVYGTDNLCIDGGASDPAAGTQATVRTCSSGELKQTWAYTNTLQIVLVSAQTPTHPTGMCLDAGTAHTNVLMQACATSGTALYQQQWSFTGVQAFNGTNAAGTAMANFCFRVSTPGSASNLILNTSCTGAYDNAHSFSPDAGVGAGMASAQYGQLVNYKQFGRCLDVTGGDPNAVAHIAWPCKQDPNPANVSWNQRWTTPALNSALAGTSSNYATGTITTTKPTSPNAGTYCVTSPLDPALGKYVTTKTCTGAANQRWTVYGKTDEYATSYQIKDSSGLYCLAPRDPNAANPDLFQVVNAISKIYVAPCNGSTLQKWNADPDMITAVPLKDIGER